MLTHCSTSPAWLNEGWIEFSDHGRSAVKGTTTLDSVIAELVEANRT
jgi:hypothetical protein